MGVERQTMSWRGERKRRVFKIGGKGRNQKLMFGQRRRNSNGCDR